MTVEFAWLEKLMHEDSLLIITLIVANIAQWWENKDLKNKFISALKGNTEVITRLLERLRQHD